MRVSLHCIYLAGGSVQLSSGYFLQNCSKSILLFPHAWLWGCADVAVSELCLQAASLKHLGYWVGEHKRFGAWKPSKWALPLEKLCYEVTLTKVSGKQIDLTVFLKYKNSLQSFEGVGGREVVSFHQGRQQFLWFAWIAPAGGAICGFKLYFRHRHVPLGTQAFNKFWALLLILVFCLQTKRVSTFQVSSGKTKHSLAPMSIQTSL